MGVFLSQGKRKVILSYRKPKCVIQENPEGALPQVVPNFCPLVSSYLWSSPLILSLLPEEFPLAASSMRGSTGWLHLWRQRRFVKKTFFAAVLHFRALHFMFIIRYIFFIMSQKLRFGTQGRVIIGCGLHIPLIGASYYCLVCQKKFMVCPSAIPV